MRKPMAMLPYLSEVTRTRSKYNRCLLRAMERSQGPEILLLSCTGTRNPIAGLPDLFKVIKTRLLYHICL